MIRILFIMLICYASFFNNYVPKTSFGAGIPDIDLYRGLSYILMLGSIYHWSIKKDLQIFNRWILNLFLFYMIVFASISWSKFDYDANTMRHLFDTTFIAFFVAVLGYNLFKKEDNARLYLKHMTIAALILSLIAIFQMTLNIIGKGDILRATGTFTNPNSLAIILVLSIPCVLYTRELSLLPKSFGFLTTICVVIGVISSVSRKGIITMIVAFCLYSLLRKKYKQFFYLLVAVIITAVALSGIPIIAERFESVEMSQKLEGKWNMTEAGLKMFIRSPLIGLGFQGYKDHFNEYMPRSGKYRYDAHNMFITALANYGIIGFIPFLYIFFYPLKIAIKTIRSKEYIEENNYLKDMALICIVSIIPFIINGWFAGGLFYGPISLCILYSNVNLFLAGKHQTKTE